MSNHNAWHICTNCGNEFDRRLESDICPNCGTKANTNRSDILMIILVIIILAISGCATQKHPVLSNIPLTEKIQKKVRRHQNQMLQEVIQYQSSISSGKDCTRPYRNWDRRPHGKRPFQFLQ